ncbi:MAG: 5'-nucleotidase C-terminal domain-containing protein [Prevotella sp.]
MKKHTLYLGVIGLSMLMGACGTHYTMSGISRTRIVVDNRYDTHTNEEAVNFLQPYSHEVDSMMSPVVGKVARYMASDKPESELSNLLTDILLWSGSRYGEKPDFGVYNMGGIRAAFAKGDVNLGAILDVAPFENKVCFLTLSGTKTKELFEQIAKRRGEGVSHGVQLEITDDGRLLKAMINGKPLDEGRSYRVVTLDYLAQGNDQLTAFKAGTDIRAPQEKKDNVRVLIRDYFKEKSAEGIVVDSKVEGRIKIVK